MVDHKKDMRSLRASLLSKPAASVQTTVADSPSARPIPAIPSDLDTLQESPANLAYVDRAKLRRSLYPASHGLSDAQPPSLANDSPPSNASIQKTGKIEPSYSMGSALYARMVSIPSGDEEQLSDPLSSRSMGHVIDVATTATKGAGIGSGMVRGVENIGRSGIVGGADWRERGKERRWNDAEARRS